MNTLTDHPRRDARSLPRRRVYLGEGLTFEIEGRDAWLQCEAVDLAHEGLGLAVVLATDVMMPAVGEIVSVRYTGRGASGARQPAVVRHVGSLQTARGTLPRLGLSLAPRDGPGSPTSIGARASATRVPSAAGVRGRGVPLVLRRDAALPHRRGRRRRDDAAHDARQSAAAAAGGARLRAAPGVDRGRERPRAVDVGAPRRGQRRLRGRRRVGRSAARAAQRAVALSPRRRRHPDARDPAGRRPHGPWRRARGDLRLRHLGAPTTTRSSPCACMPIRPRVTSTARRSPTCARRSTRTRATSRAASAGGSSATCA